MTKSFSWEDPDYLISNNFGRVTSTFLVHCVSSWDCVDFIIVRRLKQLKEHMKKLSVYLHHWICNKIREVLILFLECVVQRNEPFNMIPRFLITYRAKILRVTHSKLLRDDIYYITYIFFILTTKSGYKMNPNNLSFY